jgi:hypothetical protein
MRNRRDPDMPIGRLKRADDTLPSPEELMASERTVKVTLRLSEESIKFFKQYAERYHTKYQRVIRKLLDAYAKRFAMPH